MKLRYTILPAAVGLLFFGTAIANDDKKDQAHGHDLKPMYGGIATELLKLLWPESRPKTCGSP